ncbi:MAG: 3-mercaptopyruvate sulfurtransferase [Rhodospirillales bacterium]
MPYAKPDALVSTEWLAAHLDDPKVRAVDATWYLPNQKRTGREDFDERRIPGAAFWDIDAIADPATDLPHMLPDAAAFAAAMGALGIADDNRVVVYDSFGLMSAARAWWTLRHFGHDAVAVLDGGMPKWLAEGRPVERGAPRPPAPARFTARPRPALARGLDDMRRNLDTRSEQVLDARSAGRFNGTEPELRPQCRSGHIPGSLNLPFGDLLDPQTKTVRPAEALAQRFAAAGVDPAKPVITSCGSGITACVLALGLHLVGRDDVAVYDGSWTEWGGRRDTPVEV